MTRNVVNTRDVRIDQPYWDNDVDHIGTHDVEDGDSSSKSQYVAQAENVPSTQDRFGNLVRKYITESVPEGPMQNSILSIAESPNNLKVNVSELFPSNDTPPFVRAMCAMIEYIRGAPSHHKRVSSTLVDLMDKGGVSTSIDTKTVFMKVLAKHYNQAHKVGGEFHAEKVRELIKNLFNLISEKEDPEWFQAGLDALSVFEKYDLEAVQKIVSNYLLSYRFRFTNTKDKDSDVVSELKRKDYRLMDSNIKSLFNIYRRDANINKIIREILEVHIKQAEDYPKHAKSIISQSLLDILKDVKTNMLIRMIALDNLEIAAYVWSENLDKILKGVLDVVAIEEPNESLSQYLLGSISEFMNSFVTANPPLSSAKLKKYFSEIIKLYNDPNADINQRDIILDVFNLVLEIAKSANKNDVTEVIDSNPVEAASSKDSEEDIDPKNIPKQFINHVFAASLSKISELGIQEGRLIEERIEGNMLAKRYMFRANEYVQQGEIDVEGENEDLYINAVVKYTEYYNSWLQPFVKDIASKWFEGRQDIFWGALIKIASMNGTAKWFNEPIKQTDYKNGTMCIMDHGKGPNCYYLSNLVKKIVLDLYESSSDKYEFAKFIASRLKVKSNRTHYNIVAAILNKSKNDKRIVDTVYKEVAENSKVLGRIRRLTTVDYLDELEKACELNNDQDYCEGVERYNDRMRKNSGWHDTSLDFGIAHIESMSGINQDRNALAFNLRYDHVLPKFNNWGRALLGGELAYNLAVAPEGFGEEIIMLGFRAGFDAELHDTVHLKVPFSIGYMHSEGFEKGSNDVSVDVAGVTDAQDAYLVRPIDNSVITDAFTLFAKPEFDFRVGESSLSGTSKIEYYLYLNFMLGLLVGNSMDKTCSYSCDSDLIDNDVELTSLVSDDIHPGRCREEASFGFVYGAGAGFMIRYGK